MLKAAELKDFVHGFTEKCHELGIHKESQIKFLLHKVAEAASPADMKATDQASKSDEDYYRGTGKLVTDLADIIEREGEGEVNGVNTFTNQGTSDNYQRA
jgi:soluble cytochrome b562